MSRPKGTSPVKPESSRRGNRVSSVAASGVFLAAWLASLAAVKSLGSPQSPRMGMAAGAPLRQPLHKTVSTSAYFQEFPLRPSAAPNDLVAGPDGAMWITDSFHDEIVRMTMSGATSVVAWLPLSYLAGIATGPDGNLWFCRYNTGHVVRLTPAGQLSGFSLSGTYPDPLRIAAGPDGNMWVTRSGGKIARVTMQGVVDEFPIPTPANPVGIAPGSDGNVWFLASAGNYVGRMTPAGSVTTFPLLTPFAIPARICHGPDGALWVTQAVGSVARVSTQGEIVEFPTGSRGILGITSGPDGNLWVTAPDDRSIMRLEPTGRLTAFPIPSGNVPGGGIAVGPDGNIWFTEPSQGRIARLWIATTPVALQTFTAE